ncbi:MAG: exosortase/archaeosortase family protein [Verrucomicrobia bacterium]|nr:exosortase/archaeosortase family protein [Verrucomicrobiota bacterium]
MVQRLGISGQALAWALAALFWGWTFWACAGEWQHTDAYSYGSLVPLLGGYFFWRRWQELVPVRISDREAGLAWAVIGLAVFFAGPVELVRQTPFYWRPLLWMMGILAVGVTWAAAFLTGGRAGWRGMVFAGLFPLVSIPWVGVWEIQTTVRLQGWVAMTTGEILNWLGVAAEVNGKTIRVAGCVLGVEEACSGLQSLQSALMVALAGGEVFRSSLRRRAGLLICAAAVAVGGNLIRAVTLGLIGGHSGPEEVEHWHNLLGMGIMVAVVLAVWWMASRKGMPRAMSNLPEVEGPVLRQGRWVGVMALCWLLGVAGFVRFWYSKGVEENSTATLSLREEVEKEEVPKAVVDTLRPEKGEYFHFGKISGYHFWWSPGRGKANPFGHRPEHCMPGAGWTISGPTSDFVAEIDGQRTVWSVIPFERPDQKAVMLWANWMDGQPLEPKEYDRLREMYFQKDRTLEFVQRRISSFPFELAACLIPGEKPDTDEMTRIVRSLFHGKAAEPDSRESSVQDKLSK